MCWAVKQVLSGTFRLDSLEMFRKKNLLCAHTRGADCSRSLAEVRDPSWVQGWVGAILPSPPPPSAPGQRDRVFLRQAAGWQLCARRAPHERRQHRLARAAGIALRRDCRVAPRQIEPLLWVLGVHGPAGLQLQSVYP